MASESDRGADEVFVHICCAPCYTYPHQWLIKNGYRPTGFFFNPNIQPFREFRRRFEAMEEYSRKTGATVIMRDDYPLEEFLRGAFEYEDMGKSRCEFCYRWRLGESAKTAAEMGFRMFTTTLLSSRFQPHGLIRKIGREEAERHGIEFLYHDFREGELENVRISRDLRLYRQKYCGCVFSERDRYQRRLVRE